MKYLPFEDITYQTALDPDEILKRVDEIIEPPKIFRMKGVFGSNNHKPYEGSINRKSFNINRIIGYRNSFLPRIKGKVERGVGKTKVIVEMRLHPFVMVFMLIWCSGVGLGFIVMLSELVKSRVFDPMILIPFGMLLFGYGMTIGGFKYESIKSKKYLEQLFEAKIEK